MESFTKVHSPGPHSLLILFGEGDMAIAHSLFLLDKGSFIKRVLRQSPVWDTRLIRWLKRQGFKVEPFKLGSKSIYRFSRGSQPTATWQASNHAAESRDSSDNE